ncbi:putative peptidylprolyl isomerase [Medicago truncatula]|uniref:peptidylprolyl isomerase n=1 Tax=Medicago truncatula TaxID=3880 RepID=G7IXS8_MEDTR|nr:peptidyl-prolyl cis-trans isomerase FKBP16-1, chloroplastic [Medicago truncatula]AES70650.2 FKBP-type peptidyl-prolyl cis-trans isomerase [Medicago truncatula]RHN67450.1 putative peptidylprolyl isomerase [Medicago truncatula]
MGVLSFLSLPPCTASVSASPRCTEDAKSSNNKISTLITKKYCSRRLILRFIGINHILCYGSPALAAPIMDMNEPEVIRTLKLASGVRIQVVTEGEGPEAHGGDLVEFNCVCRRANGYFVFSTVDQFNGESNPVILPLDEDQMILGLKQVLTGMRVGGKRRALIPPSVGYVDENLKPIPEEFGPRRSLLSHAQEPLVFEVQLLKILSVPQQSEFN